MTTAGRWIACAAVVLVAACSGGGGGSGSGTGTAVFLEPVGSAGSAPFTRSVAVREHAASSATPAASTAGSTLGLYGGTRGKTSCERQQLVSSLENDPDKEIAWAHVFGFGLGQVPDYITGLTPVVLLHDTVVTEHGLRNLRATSRPVVLQAGTAVLVDTLGSPRVKCRSGDPLTDTPAIKTPDYTGSPWSAFSPSTTIVVTPAAAAVSLFVLAIVDADGMFGRPAGTAGSADVDVDASGKPVVAAPTTIDDATVSGTYTVQYGGNAKGPCTDWPKGTGSMTVTASDRQLTITLTYPDATAHGYVGTYSSDGHWVAPDTITGRNPIGGTFTIAGGGVTVPDGLRTAGSCVGGFTATKTA